MNKLKNTRFLTLLSVLAAIEMLLVLTPLGLIPLGFMNATTLHIPVIIGAIFLGPTAGAILGGVFGILSVITNTVRPNATSFVFSPFYSVNGTSGNFASLIIAIVPRILIGVVAYYVYKVIADHIKQKAVAYIGAALAGAMTNTILVMSGIYVFFGQPYAAAKGLAYDALFGIILGIIGTNGVVEAIIGAIIIVAICKVLEQVFKKQLR